ncbi:substrate-binding domain-containing protein [Curtobacterium aetherium]|uniref:Substrate-binding domain-containing protein n=1 Tax=Curtobacterium aetherium TaxID=2841594 RepID=A0ACD1E594_9MICO|nr:substrate-binding domain-containing protein [Curtobacterium sp. L6-1]QWS34100.1 substrate-binding domain-containing protein [Curtobacterium sp. L6-1]
MRRTVAVLTAALAASALVLTGCSGTTTTAPTPVRSTDLTSSDGGFDRNAVIGVVLTGDAATPSDSGDGRSLATVFREQLTEAGFRPDIRVAGADQAARQRSAVRDLVRTGAKALLVRAADPSSLRTELRDAHDAGVVVVALGSALPSSGGGNDGLASDYRIDSAGSDDELVSRSVDMVASLQRGEEPQDADDPAQ